MQTATGNIPRRVLFPVAECSMSNSYGRAVEMGAVGALCNSFRRALAYNGAFPLNLELPQSERIRRGNAWSLPKINYTSGTTSRLGQEPGPAGCGAVAGPAAGVRVVGDADV